jgi:hypothetical protein
MNFFQMNRFTSVMLFTFFMIGSSSYADCSNPKGSYDFSEGTLNERGEICRDGIFVSRGSAKNNKTNKPDLTRCKHPSEEDSYKDGSHVYQLICRNGKWSDADFYTPPNENTLVLRTGVVPGRETKVELEIIHKKEKQVEKLKKKNNELLDQLKKRGVK